MKTTIKQVIKSGYAVEVNESTGRYDFYDSEPAYALNDKIYPTENAAKRALKKYVLDNYGQELIDDESLNADGTYFRTENGAERDEEQHEIEAKVVRVERYKVEKTMTIRL